MPPDRATPWADASGCCSRLSPSTNRRRSPGSARSCSCPIILAKPLRDGADDELVELAALLGRLDLRPVDEATAGLATALGAAHRLRAADAVHLATAVATGADRFVTNNQADFPKSISEIDVTYPEDLPDLTGD